MMVCKWWLTRFSFCNLNGSDAQGPLITLGGGGGDIMRDIQFLYSHTQKCMQNVNIQISRTLVTADPTKITVPRQNFINCNSGLFIVRIQTDFT